MWRTLVLSAIDAIYPPRCVVAGCGARGVWLCERCAATIRPLPRPRCERCAEPLAREGLCPRCRHEPPPFDRAVSAGQFEGALKEAVHALKYRRRRALARPLAALVAARVAPVPQEAVVVSVPAHPRRTAERGVDHARLLADAIATALGRESRPSMLLRIRDTPPQASLSAAQRRANVAGAFAVEQQQLARCVILVDDVMTTGATVGACARALRDAGAGQVVVCTVARALRPARRHGTWQTPRASAIMRRPEDEELTMDVELSAKHFDMTDTVRNYVDRKVGRLDRYLPDIKATRVDLTRVTTHSMGDVYAAQVTAWVDAAILRAEEVNPDLFAAIDLSADKIHRQIERYKGKRQRRWQARTTEEPLGAVEDVAVEEAAAGDGGPQIVRRKRFDLVPMAENEAADQLELLGHDFYMFLNERTGRVNVLYRRRDGQLGLLEAEHA